MLATTAWSMSGRLMLLPFVLLAASANLWATSNYVYHEASTNNPGCGADNYRSVLTPAHNQALTIAFKAEYQGYHNQARVYYTTDGSTPGGAFGVGTGTTQVVTGTFSCTFNSGGVVDVVTATIPGQIGGTTVKYIVSAWHDGGGDEIFGNGAGPGCSGCGTVTNDDALATVFDYTVPYVNTYIFTGTGNWTNAGNWSPTYPGTTLAAGDLLIIDGGSVCTVPTGTTVTVNGDVTADGDLINDGTLLQNGDITINSNGINSAGATWTVSGANAIFLVENSITFANLGTMSFTNNNASESAGPFTNKGTMTVDETSAFTNSALFYNGEAGMTNTANLTIHGTFYANGTFLNEDGATVYISGSGALDIMAFFANNAGATVDNNSLIGDLSGFYNNNGLYKGSGTFDGALFFNGAEGIVSPGASPGCQFFTGDFENNASGTLNLEINGTTPCIQFDQLQVTGAFTADGTLNVNFGSFTPTLGQTFQIVTAGSYAGSFDDIVEMPNTIVTSYSNGILTVTNAGGTIYTFTGTGNWTDAGNWSPTYPGLTIASGDQAIIAAGASCTIPNGTAVTINGTLTVNGTISKVAGSTLTNSSTGTVTVANGGALNNDAGNFNNAGTLTTVAGGTFGNGSGIFSNTGTGTYNNGGSHYSNYGGFTNSGTITNTGTMTSGQYINISNSGVWTNAAGGTMSMQTISNAAAANLTNNGTMGIGLNNSGAFTNNLTFTAGYFTQSNAAGAVWTNSATGTMSLSCNPFSNSGTFTNAGSFSQTNCSGLGSFANSGTINLTGPMAVGSSIPGTNTGTININAGGSLLLTAGTHTTFTNNGTINYNAGTFTNNTTYNGSGTFAAGVFNNTGGVVAPGASPGCLVFSAGYNNGTGTQAIEIGGATPCTQHDQVQVTGGTATLSGTLTITMFGGYIPGATTSYTILTAPGGVSGTFATINYPTVCGVTWSIAYNANDVVVTATVAAQPEINVQGLSMNNILDGDNMPTTTDGTDFGNVAVNGSLMRTFTILNTGSANLTISSITSSNPTKFTIGTLTPPSPISGPNGSATFTVTFSPTATGVQNATITINNNDCNEATYDFAVTGIGVTPAAALHFDGSNDYVEAPYNAALDITGNVTLEAWVKTSTSTEQYIISRGNSSYLLAVNPTNDAPGKAAFYMHGPSPAWLNSSTRIDDGNWHHVACVRNGTTAQIFIDGVLDATGTVGSGNIGTGTDPLGIGWRSTYPTFVFNGAVDEVRIWNTARSCDQITQLRNCELTGSEPNLTAYYKFNQGIAAGDNTTPPVNTLTDATANGNNGTLNGFALNGATSNWITPGGVTTGTSCPASITYPEANVQGNGTDIADGDATPSTTDHTDFGSVAVNGSLARTFTIFNTGNAALTITDITSSNALFVVSGAPASVAANGSAMFTVTFNPTATGVENATITIDNNDCDEAVYDFVVTGKGAQPGAALHFDGVNDDVAIPHASNITFDINQDFTISLHVKIPSSNQPNTGNVDNDIVEKVGASGGYPYVIRYLNHTADAGSRGKIIAARWNGSTAAIVSSTAALNDDNWHHIAFVKSGPTLYLYVDGVLNSTTPDLTTGSTTNTGPLYLGSRQSQINWFNGSMDNLSIWNIARSCEEIRQQSNCELAGSESGLVAYYNFNHGFANENNSGVTTLTDAAGGDNNGTLSNNFALTGATSNWVTPGGVTTGTSCPAVTAPEADVRGGSPLTTINDGDITPTTTDHTDFGNVAVNGSLVRMFTIYNTGNADLTINSITSSSNTLFSVGALSQASPIQGGGSATFTVTFLPTATGVQNATITINTNDCDEAVYDFVVTGKGATPASALHFDGVNDAVNLGTSLGNFGTGDFTVETWFKTPSTGFGPLVCKRSVCAGENFWSIYIDNTGKISFQLSQNTFLLNSVFLNTSLSYNDNIWHHVALTRSGTEVKGYVDGGLVVSGNTAAPTNLNNATSLTLGSLPCGLFNGSMDEVRIWTVARTCEEINQLRNCELAGSEPGLMAYYKFNQGFAAEDNTTPPVNTLTDATANANNGTLTGFDLTGPTSNWITPGGVTTGTSCPAVSAPEADVQGGSPLTGIADGDATPSTTDGTDFGSVAVNGSLVRTFTILNTGSADLTIGSITSSNNSIFTVGTLTPAGPIQNGMPATFTVTFNPTALGVQNATITVTNDDCSEAAYDFAVTGTGVTPASALNFDGIDDYITTANNTTLDLSTQTVEFWAKPNSSSGDNDLLVGKRNYNAAGSNDIRWSIHFKNGNQGLYFFSPAGTADWTYTFTPNQWYHIAMVTDATSTKLYIDGTFISSKATTINSPTNLPVIFGASAPNYEVFPGSLDEVRIWNTARTCDQITQLRNCELTGSEPNLVAYYKFNQGIAAGDNTTPPVNTLTDATANGNNGTLTGFDLTGPTSNWVTPGGVMTGTSCPAVSAPEANLQGGSPLTSIADGDITPTTADGTDFGSILYSGSVVRMFTIQNTGDAVLTIGSITSSNTKYAISGAPSSVGVGGTATFTVTFTPTETGTHTATITVNSDDCDEAAYDFAVTGTATFPVTTIGFDCINGAIGNYYNGGAGPNVGIASSNGVGAGGALDATGNPVINVPAGFTTGFAVVGNVCIGFNINIYSGLDGTGTLLATQGGDPGLRSVAFSGVAKSVTLGRYSCPLNGYDIMTFGSTIIGTPVAESLQEINLQGNGQTILDGDATPSTADHTNFGNVFLNGSLQRTFTIQNTGTADLIVSSISSSNNARFTVGALTPASPIPAGMSATFTVTFNPIANGAQNATITVANDDCSEAAYDFAVTGTGVTPGAALDFDGVDDYVDNGSLNSLNGATTFTVESWVKRTTNTLSYPVIFSKSTGLGVATSINIGGWDAGNPGIFARISGTSDAFGYNSTDNLLPLNIWAHVAVVYNGAGASNAERLKIYVNGNPVNLTYVGTIPATAPTVAANATTGIILGNAQRWQGPLDEMRIWNTARTCDEINQLRNCELTGSEPNLVAYYKFNQGIAAGDNTTPPVNTLTDATANGNNGTLTGFDLTGPTSNWVTPGGVTTGTSCPASITYPEINVRGNGTDIADGDATPATGDHTDFSTTAFSRTFTIFNDGNSALSISNITVSGGNSGDFNITAGWPTSIAMGSSGTFTVNFAPTAAGLRTTTVRVTSNDCDEADYDFAIQATAVAAKALHFTSSAPSDNVNSPSFTAFGTQPTTIEFWAKNAGSFDYPVGFGNSVLFQFANGSFYVLKDFVAGYNTGATVSTNGTVWEHFALTWDGVSTLRTYKNGLPTPTPSFSNFAGGQVTGTLQVGEPKGGYPYDGAIDEVRMWKEERTAAQILANYNTEIAGMNPCLTVYWKFNQGFVGANNSTVTTVTDIANAVTQDGTLTGFALTGATSNWAAGSGITETASAYIPAPEVNVKGGAGPTSIPDGDTSPSTGEGTSFGNVLIGSTTTQTFTIENTGDLVLNVSGVTFTGTNAADFSVTTAPAATVAATNGSTTFTVQFAPTTTGTKNAVMHIANDDCDEADYDIAIQGVGTCIAPSFTACPTGPLTATTVANTCAAPVSYIATATGTPTPTLTYAFTGATVSSGSGTGSGSSFNKGSTTVTVTATSTCTPAATCTFTVTVTDNEKPQITCAGAVSINTTAGLCTGTTTLTNPTVTDNCPLVLGNSLHFDGSNDLVSASGLLPASPTEFTVEFWLNPASRSNYNQEISIGSAGNGHWNGFTFHTTGTGAVYVGTDIGSRMTPSEIPDNTVVLNAWQHFAYVFSSGTGKFYKNGVLLATKANGTPPSFDVLRIASGCCNPIHGALDELRIWNTARTQSQLQTFRNTELNGTESNLVAYYNFNQGTAGNNNSGLTTLPDIATTISGANNGTLTGFGLMGATSNWITGVPVSNLSNDAPATYPKGNTVVTWTATDASGNTNTCQQTVTVVDNQAPTLANPGNQSLNVAAGTCTATYTIADPITDNCTGSTWSATFSGNANGNPTNLTNIADGASSGAVTFQKGTTTVTLTGTDASSNAATQTSFTVTVTDNEVPKVTACFGTNIAAFGQATGNSTTTAANSVYQSFTAPITGVITSIQIQVGGASGLTLQVGNGTSCGGTVLGSKVFNSVGGLQTITFDTPIPVTGGVMYNFGILGNHTAGWATTGSYAGGQMYYNGCPGSPAFPNSDLVFTVNMNYVPPISLNVAPGTCGQTYAIPAPTITDNCSGPLTWNATFSGNPNGNPTNLTGLADGSPTGLISFAKGTTNVVLNGVDANGNVSTTTCPFTVTVNDNEAPTITCAAPVTVNTTAGLCTGTTTLTDPTVTDNCLLAPSNALDFDGVDDRITGISGANIANQNFTIEAWLKRGSTGSWDIAVGVGGIPVSCPGNGALYFGFDPGNRFAFTFYGNDAYTPTTYTDLNWHHWAVTFTTSDKSRKFYRDGVLVHTNTSPSNFTGSNNVIIGNTTCDGLPFHGKIDEVRIWNIARSQAEIQASMNSELAGNEAGLLLYQRFNQGTAGGTNTGLTTAFATTGTNGTLTNFALSGATSNWVAGNVISGLTNNAPATYPKGATTVTWTATDASGNTNTCQQTVTVTDNEKPTLAGCPSNILLRTNDDGNADCEVTVTYTAPTFSDNCDGSGTATHVSGPTSGTSLSVSGSPYMVVYTKTDMAGNTVLTNCTFTVTVQDNIPPTITCPTGSPFTRDADATECNYTVQGTEFDPTAFGDNCSGATISNSFNNSASLANADLPKGSTTITWTVTDGAMSSTTCAIVVNVRFPEINVQGNGTDIADGDATPDVADHTDFGATTGTPITRTFTIQNTGGVDLSLGAGAITFTGANANLFSVSNISLPASVSGPSGSITFDVTYSPVGVGLHTAEVVIASNDCDEDPYNFAIQGTRNCSPATFTACPTSPVMVNTDPDQCNALVNYTATANGTPAPTYTYQRSGAVEDSGSGTGDGLTFPTGTTSVTVTATNPCSAPTCVFDVVVTDNEKPTFTCPTPTLVLNTTGGANCQVQIPDLVALVTDANDNCALRTTDPVEQSIAAGNYNGVSDGMTIPVVVTVTDNASPANSETCTITFTVNDDDRPTFTCPTPTLVLNTTGGANCQVQIPDLVALVTDANDNCALRTTNPVEQSVAAGNYNGVSDGMTIPVVVTVTDNASPANSETCTITFTVNDDDKPTFTCPTPTLVLNTTGGANCQVVIPDLVALVTDAADNCALKTTNPITQNVAAGNYNGVSDGMTIPVTVTVTDNASPANSETCTITFTVNDDDAPTVTCPPNTTVLNTNAGASCEITVPNYVTSLDPTDNCTASGNIVEAQSIPAGAYNVSGDGATVTVHYTATDGASPANTTTCTVVITVNDDDAPTVTCPAATATINTNAGASCQITVPNYVTMLTATDNCSAVTEAQSIPAGAYSVSGHGATVTVNYTATDGASPANTTTCTVVITVNDDDAPTITCPANQTVSTAPDNCSTPPVTYNVTTTDNCSSTVSLVSGPASGSVFPLGVNTVVWRATDTGGNSTTCAFTVTVGDGQNPSIVCPASISRNTDANQCTALVAYATPAVSDNCTGWTLTRTGGLASGSAFPKGVNMVQWQVSDVGGNSAVCQFTVTVADAQAPVITCPANIVRSNDAGQCYAVVTYATPTATDNCGVSGVTLHSTANTASGSQFSQGTTTVVWKATDTASPTANTATCSFTVTVNDTQQPGITCPVNQTVGNTPGSCSATVTYATPAYSDNCAGGGATLQSGLPSGGVFPKGQTTVVWRATDAAGLTRACSFRVTVNDTEAPAITCPASQSASTAPNLCTANVTYPAPTAVDNCPGAVTVVRIGGPASGGSFPQGSTNVTWRAIDGAGRSSTCSFSVTVTDNQPPTISCPGNIAATGSGSPCSAVVGYTVPTATDNCGVQSVFLLSGLPSGSGFPAGATNVVWRAVDASGLSSTCSFAVTVGCGAQSSEFEVRSSKLAPGLESGTSNSELQTLNLNLWPNPARTEVTISVENLDEADGELTVLDAQGRLVWQQRCITASPSRFLTLSVLDFPTGVYFVTLRSEGQTLTKRLVVQRL